MTKIITYVVLSVIIMLVWIIITIILSIITLGTIILYEKWFDLPNYLLNKLQSYFK